MLDFAFDHAMVGANARREGKPASQHVSIKGGALRIRSNNDYRRDLLVDMLQTVGRLVALPDVEFLANLWDHPKVSARVRGRFRGTGRSSVSISTAAAASRAVGRPRLDRARLARA